jgi:acyl-CoA synthetase (AMP-forming)/AMP-acid ligase II
MYGAPKYESVTSYDAQSMLSEAAMGSPLRHRERSRPTAGPTPADTTASFNAVQHTSRRYGFVVDDAPIPPLTGPHETLAEAMDAAVSAFGDHEAYVDRARRITFAEWIAAADGVAAELAARGVRPGDVVVIALPPSIDYAIAYAAIVRVGAVASGLNLRLGPREVTAICSCAPPALAFVDEHGPLPGLPEDTELITRLELASASRREPLPPRRGRSSDPVTIIWTSGTTGVPKGAWFDHDALSAAVTTAGVMSAPFDRRLVPTPFAHAGYMAKLWEQIGWGMTIVISPTPWTASETIALLSAERITVAGGVPTQWAKLLEDPGLDAVDTGALRIGVVATAPAPPELVERVSERLGCALVVRYAMTESPSITGTEPGDPPDVLYRTVGRPQPGVEVELRDEAGAAVPAGAVGRVHVRSACVMRGYWNAPELTAEVLGSDGWLRSGDLGYLDPEGNLVLVGRVGDLYIRGGYNVYPLEVEHVLTEHPAVAEASVLGVPAPVIGEIGVAFVVPPAGCDAPSLDELRAWCGARLADYKAPDRLVVLDELPRTPMAKVDKEALRARH